MIPIAVSPRGIRVPPGFSPKYDLFISYSHLDAKWVRQWLLPRLKVAGIRVCIDFRDFEIGLALRYNMERAVENSRATVLVLTPNWVQSEWARLEGLMAWQKAPLNQNQKMLPILLRKCDIPDQLSLFTYADFTNSYHRNAQLRRLIAVINCQRRKQRILPQARR